MNALGVYLLISLLFVISSMLEFAVIMFLQRRHELQQASKVETPSNLKSRRGSLAIKSWSAKIDGFAMIIFLAGYALFNAVYWATF